MSVRPQGLHRPSQKKAKMLDTLMDVVKTSEATFSGSNFHDTNVATSGGRAPLLRCPKHGSYSKNECNFFGIMQITITIIIIIRLHLFQPR